MWESAGCEGCSCTPETTQCRSGAACCGAPLLPPETKPSCTQSARLTWNSSLHLFSFSAFVISILLYVLWGRNFLLLCMCMQNDKALISAATSRITAERVFNNNSKNPINNFKLLCVCASLKHSQPRLGPGAVCLCWVLCSSSPLPWHRTPRAPCFSQVLPAAVCGLGSVPCSA